MDLLLCPHVGLGCRYLSVPGRTLVGKVWDNGVFVQLRAGEELDGKRRAAFDPLVLQNKRLRFADLSRTKFFNVDLSGADLRGATLDEAFMQQAQLGGAQLQGARLREAQLQGASLFGAELQGASLWLAQLQGAWLRSAQLQGASLQQAQLQGALLEFANLQGASLAEAQLQGASLFGAQLQGALIAGAKIWRARAPNALLDDAQLDDAQFRDLDINDAPPCPYEVRPGAACPDPRSWAAWIEEWTKFIPAGQRRDAAQQRLAILTAQDQPAGAETAQGTWRNHPPPPPEAVAKRLGDLACGARDAPHIARGILAQIWDEEPRNHGTQRQTLAARMLNADCPGAKDLTEGERSLLRDIAAGRR